LNAISIADKGDIGTIQGQKGVLKVFPFDAPFDIVPNCNWDKAGLFSGLFGHDFVWQN